MPSTPLAAFPLIATDDVDRARDEVAARFCPHFLTPGRRDTRFAMVHNGTVLGQDVSLHYLRYGDEVRITPGTFGEFFLLQLPIAGTARVKVGQRVVASDRRRASLGSPTEPVDMVWSDGCQQLLVYLRRSAVEEVARAELGAVGPVVFDPQVDIDSAALRPWMRLVGLARDELEAGATLFSSPVVASHFEHTLISGLLAAQRNNCGAASAAPALSSRAVRAALNLIDDEPERPWRVAELAGEVGVSPRALHDAFQRHLGTTPMEQLRRTRLERARADLLGCDRSTTSVSDIATRWGFFHLGRFAQAYRAAYQELPSETLGG